MKGMHSAIYLFTNNPFIFHLLYYRPMTFGEVGCFLSHYFIWLKMRTENLQTVLILEDDIDFEPDFKEKVLHILEEIENVDQEWDLM